MTQVLLLGEIGNPDGDWTEVFDDDGTVGEAPDGGLLSGGFIERVSETYELTWAGSGAVRQCYATQFSSNNFHYAADIKRGPDLSNQGYPGIAFCRMDATHMMIIHLQHVDADLVDIKFLRFDGADQDIALLEEDVPLAYSAWIRIGVRIIDGVITAYRADPVTGDNEISLGTITETSDPTWIGNASYRYLGVVQHASSYGTGIAWDNLLHETVNVGFGLGSELYYLAEDSFGADVGDDTYPFGMVEETANYMPAGRAGEINLRKIYVPIAYEGSCTIRITPIVDFDVVLRPQVFSLPVPSKRRRVVLEATAAKRCTLVRVRIQVLERTGRVEFFTPDFAFDPITQVTHTVAGVD